MSYSFTLSRVLGEVVEIVMVLLVGALVLIHSVYSYLSFIVKQHDIYVISELGHGAQYKGHSRNDDYRH